MSERPSKCGDAARRRVVDSTAHLTMRERVRDRVLFNADLLRLIASGRIAK